MLAWGYNSTGQLGNGGTANSSTPVAVSLPTGTTVTAASGGSDFSLALTSTGSVLAWGYNFYGQLGTGTTTTSDTPVAATLPAGIVATAISAGLYHSLALIARGTTTVATATPAGSTSGGAVTYGATVTPVSGTGIPTGTVTFTVGAVTLCTTPSLNGAGSGTCTATNTPVGTDTVVARYSGDATFGGSTGTNTETVTTPATGKGYWMVASDGGIFAFGGSQSLGSTVNLSLNKPVVGMTSTPDGGGYWLVASDGGVFSFGDAGFYGSEGAATLNKPVVGIASTPGGKGYWLVASDGGVFSFGDAPFAGSEGAATLNKPVVGMASPPPAMKVLKYV
jgi:hypothetical protein